MKKIPTHCVGTFALPDSLINNWCKVTIYMQCSKSFSLSLLDINIFAQKLVNIRMLFSPPEYH